MTYTSHIFIYYIYINLESTYVKLMLFLLDSFSAKNSIEPKFYASHYGHKTHTQAHLESG